MTKRVRFELRLPPALHRKLAALAKARGVSINAVILTLLAEVVE